MTSGGISRRAFLPASAAVMAAPALGLGAAQEVAKAPPGTVLAAGNHRIDTNLTIKGDLLLQPGATIDIAAGRTLTLCGGLVAPISPIFTGAGTIDLNRSRIWCAHPEWWGGVPGNSGHDCLPAMQACLRAHPVMHLLAADYHIADTFVVDRPFCRVVGSGFRGTVAGQGTRIIVSSGTADVMRAGPATAPSAVNDFCQNVSVRSVALCRSVAVDVRGGALPVGLRAQFLLFADVAQVSAFEHGIGFVARGLVRSTFTDCVAFRSLPGQQAAQPFRGFWLDGSRDIGLAGGNASLFLRDCNATIGGAPGVGDAVGLLIEGAFADTFITDFETAGVATGIRVDGQTAVIGERARDGHLNLHIHLPIIDQCSRVGIEVIDVSQQALIDLGDPYVAVAPGAFAALRFDRMRGTSSIVGGQIVGTTNSNARGDAVGIAADASRGLRVNGLKILEHRRPIALVQCSGFSLDVSIINPGSRTGGSAITLRDCDSGTATVFVSGQAGAFAGGIRLEGRASRLRFDVTGIDPGVVGGSANRVTTAGGPLLLAPGGADLIVAGV